MIDSKDLRIGNIFHYKHENTDVLIHRIDWLDFKEITQDSNKWNKFHKPIPLTEDILLKCGFVKDKLDSTYYKGDFDIFLPKFIRFKILILNDIKYIHQFQNIYYALTNQELNVQL